MQMGDLDKEVTYEMQELLNNKADEENNYEEAVIPPTEPAPDDVDIESAEFEDDIDSESVQSDEDFYQTVLN